MLIKSKLAIVNFNNTVSIEIEQHYSGFLVPELKGHRIVAQIKDSPISEVREVCLATYTEDNSEEEAIAELDRIYNDICREKNK